MGQIFKAGTKLSSTVCQAQIMILRAPASELEISCGGALMQEGEPDSLGDLNPDLADGALVGKRYVDEEESMEFLCTRAGEGTIAVNGTPLTIKQAKQLPSSD